MNLAFPQRSIFTIHKSLKRASVALCVCSHRKVDVNLFAQCMPLFANKKHDYTWIPMTSEADICQARSRASSYFYLNMKDDVLFFIDDDIVFKEEDLSKIVDHVVGGKLICGGMYVAKPTIGKTIVLEDGDSITFSKDAKIKKVIAIPTGFMGISRKVLDIMVNSRNPEGRHFTPLCNANQSWKFYPFFSSQAKNFDGEWRWIPEDWNFCLRAKECGIDVWCDPSVFLSHTGDYEYDLRDKLREPKISWESFTSVTLK